MRTTLLTGVVALLSSVASAIPLPIVPVRAPDVNCVFSPSCTLSVTDTTSPLALPGGAGTGFLQSRTFAGQPGAPGEGLTGYEYRIDLRAVRGITFVPCVNRFTIDFGPGTSLDYDRDGDLERVYVVTQGGLGSVGPSSADKVGNEITFEFAPSVCAGQTSFFFGLASPRPPRSVTAQVRAGTGELVDLAARVPGAPPSGCAPRPDLNDDLTADQRLSLSTTMQDFLTGGVLELHLTTPGIHGSSLFLPWHRDYLGDLENFLITQGHPEFVPLPKWDPAKPIPAEFTAIDADCVAPPTCDPLANTTPNLPLPADLTGAGLCANYPTQEDLRLGPPVPGLESYHNGVHTTVGGAMRAFNSPAAVVFWPWHAFVDDVWRAWQCCPGRLLPFDIRELIARPCLEAPCWSSWFGLDDLRFLGTDRLQVEDRRGFDNAGTLVGNPRAVPGMVGGALAFDGIDDHVRVADHPDLDVGSGDFSIDAWVKTTAKGLRPIVAKQDRRTGFLLFLLDGRLGVHLGPATAWAGLEQQLIAPAGKSVADGKWHHVAVAVDRDVASTLYVDSLPVLRFDPAALQGDLSNAADLLIGRAPTPGGKRGKALFEGEIDELDLFRLVLTEDEIDGIVSAGAAGKLGSLAGFAPIVRGDCLNDLRALIVNLPRITGLSNDSLLAKVDKAIKYRRRGKVDRALRALKSLNREAHRLFDGSFDRSGFMTVAHKTEECLEERVRGRGHR